MSKNDSISMSVIRRLPRYYRFLSELNDQNIDKISSTKLAQIMNVTASQVRQDLNCFGGFGQQGYGYSVSQLKEEIKNRPSETFFRRPCCFIIWYKGTKNMLFFRAQMLL